MLVLLKPSERPYLWRLLNVVEVSALVCHKKQIKTSKKIRGEGGVCNCYKKIRVASFPKNQNSFRQLLIIENFHKLTLFYAVLKTINRALCTW